MKQIPGQISLAEYTPPQPIIHPVDIRNILDDAYCPRCNYCLDEIEELDCKQCPVCGLYIDWAPWHRMNDKEENHEGTD